MHDAVFSFWWVGVTYDMAKSNKPIFGWMTIIVQHDSMHGTKCFSFSLYGVLFNGNVKSYCAYIFTLNSNIALLPFILAKGWWLNDLKVLVDSATQSWIKKE